MLSSVKAAGSWRNTVLAECKCILLEKLLHLITKNLAFIKVFWQKSCFFPEWSPLQSWAELALWVTGQLSWPEGHICPKSKENINKSPQIWLLTSDRTPKQDPTQSSPSAAGFVVTQRIQSIIIITCQRKLAVSCYSVVFRPAEQKLWFKQRIRT